ncbi:hypothetical protein OSTOST_04939, partial [Ostertagia ostertagi]
MDELMPFIVYLISVFSLLGNLIFIIIYYRCPLTKIKSYKYFFLFTAIHDIIFTLVFLLSLPRVVSQDYIYTVIATGVLSHQPFGSILLMAFCVSFFTSTLILTNSFIYRYVLLCRNQLFHRISAMKTVVAGSIINSILMIYFCATVYVIGLPNQDLENFVKKNLAIPVININDIALIGFSAK